MRFFDDLGSLVEQRWRDHSYDERAFPGIAARALEESSPDQHVSPWEIIRWLYGTPRLPRQQDLPARFGNPPITLYTGPRFYIDVYFWLDGTTSIHQHSFSGAFQVLDGSSLHSQYRFFPRVEVNQHFVVGDMVLETVELLEKGDIRPVAAGMDYIHSLFHLDRPSTSLCIRTYQTITGSPQYHYHKPFFATDPFLEDPLMIKQAQSASLLFAMQHPDTDAMIGELLSNSSFPTAFAILKVARSYLDVDGLEKAFGLSTGEERFQALLEITRRRHGELADFIAPVLDEGKRQVNLVNRRQQITSNEHRFFLALLLNVPDRLKILELVRQRYPDQNPVTTILEWVEELGDTKIFGSSESNVLGINNPDDEYLFALQGLLEGFSIEEMNLAFELEFAPKDSKGSADRVQNLYEEIRHSLLFKSIFLNSLPAMEACQAISI